MTDTVREILADTAQIRAGLERIEQKIEHPASYEGGTCLSKEAVQMTALDIGTVSELTGLSKRRLIGMVMNGVVFGTPPVHPGGPWLISRAALPELFRQAGKSLEDLELLEGVLV